MRYAFRVTPATNLGFLAGGGEMGERMRAHDWSKTPLGPPATWPQALKTCVRIVLTSRQPMFVWWGDLLVNLYNDAYKSIVGGKHPVALGQPASVVWREIWDEVGPRAARTMGGTEGTYDEALLLIMERHGYREETYYTFSYSPVPNDDGGTGGIICANTDDTRRIVGERQIALLRDLAARTSDAKRIADAVTSAAAALESNPRDLTFSLVYLFDAERTRAHLSGSAGIARGHAAAPETIAIDDASIWPLGEVARTQEAQIVDVGARFTDLPTGAWAEPPSRAIALPIAPSGSTGRAGVLVVGLNPFRLLDDDYRGFLTLVAGQIGASIGNAQAYEEEKRRAEALSEIDRAKTTFFSNVSHEFRTPLTLMLAPIEDMRAEGTTAVDRERLDLLHRNALRLLKLVNTLLDFSRIEAGRAEASYAPTDLAALTTDIASNFRSAMERAGLSFVVDCAPLPEPVYVDREMWEKIVLNLLSNAFKFTFEGGVSVRQHDEDGHVVLEVIDTGVGVAEHELPRLFERFHRVEGARARSHEGSGIGLALVHELVRLNAGRVDVTSALGRGTTFRVVVPMGTAHLPKERIEAARSLRSTAIGAAPFVQEALRWIAPSAASAVSADLDARATPDAPRARIVIADDNADMREYMARVLGEHWTVEVASDGQAALDAMRRAPPDLVVSDVMMPRMDGFALLRAVRSDARLRSVPVILLSARAGEEAVADGLRAGADDYIVKPFGARALVSRVTARLLAAKTREEERRRLQMLLAQLPAIVNFLRGPDLVIELAHPKTIETLGGRDIVGKPLLEALPELAEQPFYERLRRVYETGEPFVQREALAYFVIDGERRESYWDSVYLPVRDAAGRVEGVMTFDIDVTANIEVRRSFERAERRFRALVEANVIGVLVTTEAGILEANDAFLRMIHRSRDDLEAGRIHWRAMTPPEHTAKDDAALEQLRGRGFFDEFEKEYVLADGTRVPFLIGGARVEEEPLTWICYAVDLTEGKRARAQLEETNQQLAEANRAKDEFLAMLGHELRNPLAPIATAVHLLKLRAPESVAREISVIERQSQHIARLVDDLLDVSRIARGKVTLHREPLEIAELVAAAVETASPLIEKAGHALVLDVAKRGLTIDADRARMTQVLSNLLTNAAKYTPAGGRITVSAAREGAEIVVAVSDTGVGMSAELLPRVFDTFVQAHQTLDRAQGGLGLGLSLVKNLVKLHGGAASAHSDGPGRGSTFTVRLPASDVTRAVDDDATPAPAPAAEARAPRILIVDDNPDGADMLAVAFERLGYRVAVAHDGPAALRVAAEFAPHVALLDVGLPVMDGYELATHLRARWRYMKLVAVTGYGQDSDRERARAAGFQAHMTKPVDIGTLAQLVANLLGPRAALTQPN